MSQRLRSMEPRAKDKFKGVRPFYQHYYCNSIIQAVRRRTPLFVNSCAHLKLACDECYEGYRLMDAYNCYTVGAVAHAESVRHGGEDLILSRTRIRTASAMHHLNPRRSQPCIVRRSQSHTQH